MRYVDRADAGRRLAPDIAEVLSRLSSPPRRPLILGVPRGGVIVGGEAARLLSADLGAVLARKIGAPHNPELAIGAVGESGDPILDQDLIRRFRISEEYLRGTVAAEHRELQRRMSSYRGKERGPEIVGRVVVVVDDGIATGATLLATLETVQDQQPGYLVCAVPVGATESVERIAVHVDAMVCPLRPRWFRAVGEWYEDFAQTTDDEVIAMLKRSGTGQA